MIEKIQIVIDFLSKNWKPCISVAIALIIFALLSVFFPGCTVGDILFPDNILPKKTATIVAPVEPNSPINPNTPK